MSSRGYETDLIESICDNIALASHLEELLREEYSDDTAKMLSTVLKLRRRQMSHLLEMGDSPNPKFHCIVKHALGAWWKQTEVFEATMNREDYELAQELGNVVAMALSKYLGLEFQTCQRCLWDILLQKDYDTMKANKEMKNDN